MIMKAGPEPMPISSTEARPASLVSFVGEDGSVERWLLVDGSTILARGVPDELPATDIPSRTMLAVPGSQVTMHWLTLDERLSPAQASAAARLMLADASAGNAADMHVAIGRPEAGLTPVAVVPSALMEGWIASADPDQIVPSHLLLAAPAAGLVRRDRGTVADYRGLATAFSVEPDLAALLIGDAAVTMIDEEHFEAGLGAALSPPAINLRQGIFARRRQWKVDQNSIRRVALLAIALVAATLIVQVALIMRYTFAADRLEAEAASLVSASPAGARDLRPGFAPLTAHLFEAVRAVPNIQILRVDYRPDGALAATVEADNPATLAAFRLQIEAGGIAVEGGSAATGAPNAGAELVLRPA
jgi:general secretion pathway protein L